MAKKKKEKQEVVATQEASTPTEKKKIGRVEQVSPNALDNQFWVLRILSKNTKRQSIKCECAKTPGDQKKQNIVSLGFETSAFEMLTNVEVGAFLLCEVKVAGETKLYKIHSCSDETPTDWRSSQTVDVTFADSLKVKNVTF